MAYALGAPRLMAYLSICITLNEYDMVLRKLRQSDASLRKSRRRKSFDSKTNPSTPVSRNISSDSIGVLDASA